MSCKLYILNCVFCLLSFGLYGQTISGTVSSGSDKEPMIGASVGIKGTTIGVLTDYDGKFEFNYNGGFPAILEISYLGYVTQEFELQQAKGNINIILEEESVKISEVIVKGQRISEKQKAAPLTVETLDAISIKQTASTDFYNGLGALKGVDLTTASLGFTVINTRGFNSTSPVRSLQTIDGVDNQSPGLNFSLGNFLGAPELDVQKVDIVVGASSAFYGPNAFNGVISMETKNPFYNRGVAASIKGAERGLIETAFRYADVLNNKSGKPIIGYKINFSYLQANDWVADNYDAVTGSEGNRVFSAADNPGGANAVNIYGDEYSQSYASLADIRAGLNSFHRKGYKEEDLVDYDTRNIKGGVAFHVRTQPNSLHESPELIFASNFGYGTTVYQGDNRFSLRGIRFHQHRIEYRKSEKFFLRAYMTHEDAGQSYDPYLTAQRMLEASATNEQWQNAYVQWWVRNDLGAVYNQMRSLGYPNESMDAQIKWQQDNAGLLDQWHAQALQYANTANPTFSSKDFYEPGTARFDSLFNHLTSRLNNSEEKGTRFFDRSALYHLHGEYKFNSNFFKEIVVGGNGRVFRPNSKGTIFSDSTDRITNSEFGLYSGVTKVISNFTLSATIRMDKNQNFGFLVSPAGSLVWNPSPNNYLRASFSSAIRNPTLSDQYLNLRVGPAQLVGNLEGRDSLITFESFSAWRNNSTTQFVYRDIDPIRPERVKTFELGYRTSLFNSLYIDASYYFNRYDDFIGFQIGLVIPEIEVESFPGGPPIRIKNFSQTQVYRISANSNEIIYSQGGAIGLSYYFSRYYALNGNYSFNELNTQVDDPIVPAFNTPRHKFNAGISGRDIPIRGSSNTLGFNINYKWIEGFIFEGSPQFTGFVPSYDLLDTQISYNIIQWNVTLKAGASNVLNNKQFQTYGGPRIGRMAYFSILYDYKKKS